MVTPNPSPSLSLSLYHKTHRQHNLVLHGLGHLDGHAGVHGDRAQHLKEKESENDEESVKGGEKVTNKRKKGASEQALASMRKESNSFPCL